VTSAQVIWLVMGAGVIAYALTAGADFGGGIWHLFARGPRAARERAAIEHAIAPIWEANHVWLIFVVVMMFTAFPSAYAVVTTALHIPVTLALIGIVVRGSAFVFHAYDVRPREGRGLYSFAFGLSSLVTPLFLGDVLGALSTGEIRWDGRHVTTGFFAGWTTPFAIGRHGHLHGLVGASGGPDEQASIRLLGQAGPADQLAGKNGATIGGRKHVDERIAAADPVERLP
jgi:cytochrome d ubiquinol oxidase subunit II